MLTAAGAETVTANAGQPPVLLNPGDQTNADMSGYARAVLVDAPVQYLRLEDASGARASDWSGTGRLGTYHGAIGYGQAGAVSDGTTGVSFDGTNGTYVDAALPGYAFGTGNLSAEVWIKTTVADGVRRYIADNKVGGSNAAGFSLAIENGMVVGKVANGTAQITLGAVRRNLNDGTWHHVVAVLERRYDGTHDRLLLYLDGVLDARATLPAAAWNITSTRNVNLGRLMGVNGYSFVGALDEWALYDTALSAPKIAAHYARRTSADSLVALPLTASDPDGDTLTYSAIGLPAPLTVHPTTGLISGTLSPASAGSYQVMATVSDGGLSHNQTFMWTVTHTNRAPIVTSPGPQTSAENTNVSLQVAASDPDGDALTYTATGLPTSVTLTPETGRIAGTLSFTSAGTYLVTVTASDGNLSQRATFAWTVTNTNGPPVLLNPGDQTNADLSGYPRAVLADAPVQYLRLEDSSGGPASDWSGTGRFGTYHGAVGYGQAGAVSDGTPGVSFDGTNGTFLDAALPGYAFGTGSLSAEVWIKTTVADGVRRYIADNKVGGSNAAGFSLAIENGMVVGKVANGTAQITLGAVRRNLNDGTWHHVVAVLERRYDGTHDRLLLYLDGVLDARATLPAAAWNITSTRNINLGRLMGINGYSFVGALDEWALYDTALSAPQIATHFAQRTSADTVVALSLSASDPDGDTLTYSAIGLPAPLTVHPTTGLISGTLSPASAGSYQVMATVSDGGLSHNQTFMWTVTHTNRAPIVTSPGPQTSAENTNVSLQVAASDPDDDALTYTATGLPASVTLTPETGRIAGTLSFTSAGTYLVTVTASDGSLSQRATFAWTVTNTNGPPVLLNPGDQTNADLSGYPRAVLADAPVQYLRLEDASGAPASDWSGTGRLGTYHGAIGYGQAGAISDGTPGVSFDGTNGTYVDAALPGYAFGTGSLSAEVWIKTTVADGVRRYIADNKVGGSNAAGFSLAIENGMVVGKVANGTAQITLGAVRRNLNDGTWHHVVGVLERRYDGTHDRLLLYLDGVLDARATLPAAAWNITSTRNINLGRLMGINGYSFVGALDEWALYDTALSAPQIATHFAQRTSADTVVALSLSASDPDGDPLTYSAIGLPSAFTVNPATGLISGTLSPASVGTYQVTATASDSGLSHSQTFTWTITNYPSWTPGHVTALTLTADRAAPQPPGTAVIFTAAATGGTAPLQFKWFAYSTANGWTLLRDWSTQATYTWTTTAVDPSARLTVWVRSAGDPAAAPEKWADLSYPIQIVEQPIAARLLFPADGALNVSLAQPLTWTPIANAEAYRLEMGTTAGASDLIDTGDISETSYNASSLSGVLAPASVAWDADANDALTVQGFAMVLDNERTDFGSMPPTGCGVAGSETPCYRITLPPLAPGAHTIAISAYNALGEAVAPTIAATPAAPRMFVRLWTKAGGTWQYTDSGFTPGDMAARFVYPVPSAIQVDITKPLQWNAVPGAEAYSLAIGRSPGGAELLSVPALQTTSYLAATLPGYDLLFARLGTKVQGTWRYTDASFVASPAVAQMTFPLDNGGGVKSGNRFWWTGVPGAEAYYLQVGTTTAGADLVNSPQQSDTSYVVGTLPTDTWLYLRLWTKFKGEWRYVDSTFRTAAAAGAPGTRVPSNFIAPLGGAVVDPGTLTFTWTAVPQALGYHLHLGTSPGSEDLRMSADYMPDTTFTVSGLPAGVLIYARLYTQYAAGDWDTYVDIAFTVR